MFQMMKIAFEVLVEPVPLSRPRFSRGRAYLPARSRDYRQILQQAARRAMAGSNPMTGELFCRMVFYRKFAPTSRRFGDADNHVKAVLDALNGICFEDDAQIVAGAFLKRTDKAEPRLEVEIGKLGFEQVKLPTPIEGATVYMVRCPRLLADESRNLIGK